MADMSSGKNSLASKNIVKSPNSTFDTDTSSPRLTSNERNRVKDASSIFIAKFFEEQKKQRKDTAEKTLTSKLSKPITKQKSVSSPTGSASGDGWLSKLLGMLGLGALTKFLKPGALKALFKKGLTKLAEKLKKVLSSIWKGIKGLFSKLWGGIKSMASKIWNSKFVKGLRGIVSKAWSKIKGVFGSIKNKIVGIFKSIGRSISNLWGKITNSKAYKAFSGIIQNAKSAISKLFQGIKNKISSVVKSATEGISKVIPGGVKKVATKAGSFVKGLIGKAGSVLKSGGKAIGGAVVKGGKAIGGAAVKGGKAIGGAAVNAAKGVVNTAAKGVIKSSGGMLKLMGRLTAKGAAKVPIIGPAIEAAFTANDIKKLKAQGLTDSELQQQAGRRVISGVSGMLGSAGGAAIAGTLGSIIPGAGTALGAIVGAIGGDLAGRFLGGLITDYIIPKKYTKTIGAFVTGTTPPKDEMQDFIIKNGRVYKFNKRDEVMGMKTGGAINQFLQGGNGSNQTMRVMVKANSISIQYLRAIAHNTAMMVQKISNPQSGGGSPIIVSNSQPQQSSKQMVTIPNNRDGFASSAYAIG